MSGDFMLHYSLLMIPSSFILLVHTDTPNFFSASAERSWLTPTIYAACCSFASILTNVLCNLEPHRKRECSGHPTKIRGQHLEVYTARRVNMYRSSQPRTAKSISRKFRRRNLCYVIGAPAVAPLQYHIFRREFGEYVKSIL